MLVEALGPTGFEGIFRVTCVRRLEMMRQHRELILSILDTFLFDPLTSWINLVPHINEIRALNGSPPLSSDELKE